MTKSSFAGRESLSRNLAANLGAYWVSVVIAFLISPFVIHTLGDARYGVWSLASELTSYYGLLDLGLRGAVSYFVAFYLAQSEAKALRQSIASAFWVLCGLGLVVLSVGLGLAVAFPYLFDTRGLEIGEIRLTLSIMSLLLAVSLPLEVLNSILTGMRRIDLVSGVEVVTRVATAVAIYYVLRAGGGLVGLSLVSLSGRTVNWIIVAWVVRRLCGRGYLSPRHFRMGRLKELAGYGLRNVAGQGAVFLTNRSGNLIIGFFMGVRWVTYYAIGQQVVSYAVEACATAAQAFTPHLAQLCARREQDQLMRLYLAGLRVSGLLAVGLAAGLACFAHNFLALWVGGKYVAGYWTERSDVVMLILLIGQFPRLLQGVSLQLLFASAKVRFPMWMRISEAVGKIVVALLLVKPLGIAGVAFGVLAPVTITHLFFLPRYVLREFSLPVGRFIRDGIGRPLVAGTGMLAAGLALTRVYPPVRWASFAAEVALICAVGAVLAWTVGFTASDRAVLKAKLGGRAGSEAGRAGGSRFGT